MLYVCNMFVIYMFYVFVLISYLLKYMFRFCFDCFAIYLFIVLLYSICISLFIIVLEVVLLFSRFLMLVNIYDLCFVIGVLCFLLLNDLLSSFYYNKKPAIITNIYLWVCIYLWYICLRLLLFSCFFIFLLFLMCVYDVFECSLLFCMI